MVYKLFIVLTFALNAAQLKAQFSGDLLCNPDSVTYTMNKVWEYDDGFIVSIEDSMHFENKTFYALKNNQNFDTRYYAEDKDGNTYILTKDKKKCFLFFPKEEIPDYKVHFDGRNFMIKSYHASIRTPYCIYDDVIMSETLTFKEYFKRGVGEVLLERKNYGKYFLKKIYYRQKNIVEKKE